MNLEFSKDQQLVKSSAREFLQKECPKEIVREIAESESGHSEALWQKMADLGWMGMPIPEQYGGLGGPSVDFVELAALLEEMGYNLLPAGFFSTIVLGALPILAAGTESQKRFFLPAIAEGRLKLGLAVIEPDAAHGPSGIQTEAMVDAKGYRIRGRKLFVENAHIADYLICAARTAKTESPEKGITLFIVDAKSPGLSIKPIPTIGLERQCEVEFQEIAVSRENALGEIDDGWSVLESILQNAAIAKCAEMLGAMEACLDITSSYVKKRTQYGQVIGSFQVIQHYLANVWMDIVGSRDIVYKAASTIDAGVPSGGMASIAKAWVGRAFVRVAEKCVEMHGAIGMTKECDIGLYYRQTKVWDLAFGSAENHLSLIGETLEKGLRRLSGRHNEAQ